MFDNPQGSDVVTEETSADEQVSTDATVEPMDIFYGSEDEATESTIEDVESSSTDEVSTDTESDVEAYSFTLKADGEEHVLTSEEKVREYASKGIKFYNEMEILANDKKSFQAEKQEFEAKQTEAIQKLESFIEAQPELDIEAMGAEEYVKQKEQREAANKALTEAKEAQALKHQEAVKQYQTNEVNLLANLMGESWNDTEVMNADIQAAKELFKEFGATEQELATAVNHKFWHIGIQAAKDRARLKEFEAKKEAVSKQIKVAPKAVKSGGKTAEVRSAEDVFYS